jgi:hypothetical protein
VVPAAFVGTLLFLLVMGCFWRPAFAVAAIALGIYLGAVLVASVLTAAKNEWKLLPLLPVAFFCFHFGYGYGSLRGVLSFLVLQKAPATRFVQLTREQRPAVKAGRA